MSEIHKLSSHIADLIAAGEVVERPMSVVKELLENAIDAGSKNIVIEIENGGISYIRVTDDGKGMSYDDAKICFLRHATSKIYDENDLFSIKTLGFRGEALAAISAVSKIDLFTKQASTFDGTFVSVEAGEVLEASKAGAKDGTTIIIRDLFFNTPARMKFLKKDYTEASYVTGVCENIALSHPEIAIKYIKDGKIILKTNGNGDLKSTIYSVLGREISNEVTEIKTTEIDGISINGYISKPNFAKATRNLQHFFVNGRYVKSKIISVALEEAYKNRIMNGKFPICVLNILVDERKVDVNVHPTKTEIKFENDKKIFDIVYLAAKNSLDNENILVSVNNIKTKEQPKAYNEPEIISEPISIVQNLSDLNVKNQSFTENLTTKKEEIIPINTGISQELELKSDGFAGFYNIKPNINKPSYINISCDDFDDESKDNEIFEKVDKTPQNINETYEIDSKESENTQIYDEIVSPIKFIGECFNTYILCEYNDDFIMIDKHAAHERLNFNKLMKNKGEITSQVLISPKIVNLPREEYGNFVENLDEINKIGFLIEDFANGSVVVREIPAILDDENLEDIVLSMSTKLMENKNISIDKIDDILHMIACKSAIKGNKYTTNYELEELAKQVILNSDVNFCPHGRPVKIAITKYEIEKMFKRIL